MTGKRFAGFAALVAVLGLAWGLRPRGLPAPTPTSLPPGWSVDHRVAPEFVRPRELLLETPPPGPREFRLVAAGLRARARSDPAYLADLARRLQDPATPESARAVIALVLGTIEGAPAREALLLALSGSRAPAWTALLLHALGAEKTGEDDEVFDLPEDGPYVQVLAGLSLRIRTVIDDSAARAAVAPHLSAPEVELRRAAARALAHSAGHADVRERWLALLDGEADDGIRSGFGHALAAWAAGHAKDGDAGRVLDGVLRRALRPDDDAFRFRVEEPLRRAELGPVQVRALLEAAERADGDAQLWALSALKGREGVEETGRRVATAGGPKAREYAVELLAGCPGATDALERALGDGEWNVRLAAVRALKRRPGSAARLEQAARSDPDERVRLEASSSPR